MLCSECCDILTYLVEELFGLIRLNKPLVGQYPLPSSDSSEVFCCPGARHAVVWGEGGKLACWTVQCAIGLWWGSRCKVFSMVIKAGLTLWIICTDQSIRSSCKLKLWHTATVKLKLWHTETVTHWHCDTLTLWHTEIVTLKLILTVREDEVRDGVSVLRQHSELNLTAAPETTQGTEKTGHD